MYTWQQKKEQKYASLRQIPRKDSVCTENFDISSPREAETIWAFFVFSVGEKNYNCDMLLAVFPIIMKKIPLKTS